MKKIMDEKINEEKVKEKYDVIVAGGGIAGLTAAIYIARAAKSVLVLEAEYYGGQIVNAGSVENYPGIRRIAGYELSQNVYSQAVSLGANCVYGKIVNVKKGSNDNLIVTTETGKIYNCNAFVIAAGTARRKLDIPGEEKFKGKGVSYCATCDGAFFKGKDVAVAGGGNSALGEALHLADICNKVYIIHRRDEFRAEAHLTGLVNKRDNIECIMNSSILAVKGNERVEKIEIIPGNTQKGKKMSIDVSCLFVSIGYEPQNKVFASLVELDESGYVISGENCHTSCDGVYVAGDCRTKNIRQLVTAAADGTVAAIEACKYISM